MSRERLDRLSRRHAVSSSLGLAPAATATCLPQWALRCTALNVARRWLLWRELAGAFDFLLMPAPSPVKSVIFAKWALDAVSMPLFRCFTSLAIRRPISPYARRSELRRTTSRRVDCSCSTYGTGRPFFRRDHPSGSKKWPMNSTG